MEIDEFRAILTSFLSETGMSKRQVALEAKVPQSQVSNWSNGGGVRVTPNSMRVLNVIESYRDKKHPRLPRDIETAVQALLNGESRRTEAVERVLISLQGVFST